MSCSRYRRPPTPPEILAELQVIWPGCERRADRRGEIYGTRRISSLPRPWLRRVKWLLKWDHLHRMVDPTTGGTLADMGWSVRLAEIPRHPGKVFAHPLKPGDDVATAWDDADEPEPVDGPPPALPARQPPPARTPAAIAVQLRRPLPQIRRLLESLPPGDDPLEWCRQQIGGSDARS